MICRRVSRTNDPWPLPPLIPRGAVRPRPVKWYEAERVILHGVLLFDHRGEGASEDDPNAFGWDGDHELDAAVAYLRSRRDVDPSRIGGISFSVGGAMLSHAAARSHAFRAIVSEGASGQSIRADRANGRSALAGSSAAAPSRSRPPSSPTACRRRVCGATSRASRRRRCSSLPARCSLFLNSGVVSSLYSRTFNPRMPTSSEAVDV